MKKASLLVTPVVGLPQVSGWAQVAANSHLSAHRFVCSFSVEGGNAGNIGRTISESIVQFTPGNTEDALAFFENLEGICEAEGVQFSGSGLFFSDSQTAFMSIKGAVILKRGSKVGQLLQPSDELQVLVGKHKADDVIVLATSSASVYLPEIEQKFKTGFDTDTIITSIVPLIHSSQNSSLASLAFIVRTEIDLDSDVSIQNNDEPELLIETEFFTNDQAEDVAIAEPLISAQAVESANSELLKELGVNQPKKLEPSAGVRETNKILTRFWRILILILIGTGSLLKKLLINLKHLNPSKIKKFFADRKIPSLDGSKTNRKKIIPPVIAGISLVLISIILVFLVRNKQATELSEAKVLVAPIRTQIVTATEMFNQNPIESRQQVRQSVQQLESMLAEAKESGKSKGAVLEIGEALKFASETEAAISGQLEVNTLNTFYDIRLVSSDFVASTTNSNGAIAIFFDRQTKQLILLNLENKQVRTMQVDLPIKSMSMSAEKLFLLADGVYSLDLNDEAAIPIKIVDEGDSNRDASLIRNYEIYIYAFNESKRNVYRYANQNDDNTKYSDPVGWMQAIRGLEYATVVDMAVDGDLWLTTRAGQLLKFTSGRAQDFSPIGLENAFSSPLKIYTNAELQKLYVLEPEKKRLIILEKDGTFLKEIISSSLAAATDIFVSESLGRAYAVSGSIIYDIPL